MIVNALFSLPALRAFMIRRGEPANVSRVSIETLLLITFHPQNSDILGLS